jgi:hypothetical protein
MRAFDVPLPTGRDEASLPAAVQEVCAAAGLTVTLDGTLKQYPGSRHWHFQRGTEAGTLEITWWPAKRRLWLKIAAGRERAWITEVLPGLQAALAAAGQALPVLVAEQPRER